MISSDVIRHLAQTHRVSSLPLVMLFFTMFYYFYQFFTSHSGDLLILLILFRGLVPGSTGHWVSGLARF